MANVTPVEIMYFPSVDVCLFVCLFDSISKEKIVGGRKPQGTVRDLAFKVGLK